MNIINGDRHDGTFIRERTEDFETLGLVVAEICEIPVDGIREIVRAYAQTKSAAISYYLGITEYITDVDNVQDACDMGGLPNVHPGYQVKI